MTSENQNSKQFIVVIDPGHGGKDPGAVNKTIREKDVVLGIGLKLGELIKENYPDVKVVFTRSTDVFIPLIERSRIANKGKADLFISIHANFCATPSTRGTETFFLGPSRSDENLEVAKKENSVILLEKDYSTTYEGFDPNSSESNIMFAMFQSSYLDQSLYFADNIQNQFKSRSESPNRGVKQAGFLVLRLSSMPSVLIETGFLSNPSEANYLSSDDGQRQVALSVFEAFRKFKNKNSGGSTTKGPEVIASNEKPQETKTKPQETITKPLEVANKPLEVATKQKSDTAKQKTEEKKQDEIVEPTINLEKREPEKTEIASSPAPDNAKKTESNEYYSVQIGANTTPVEPVAANFKGLKNIRREKSDRYYRYYIGNESSIDNITQTLKQIKLKFPQAFIVSFIDGKRIPLNIGLK
ncbi:MAG TPA: N-acetylmuramoyl-L-alanine amidase [Prolixibacteraceae bacterium]|jgi:N-acetylmuramoyl-L-alanine amidase